MEEIVFPNQLRMLRRIRGRRIIELAVILMFDSHYPTSFLILNQLYYTLLA